MHTSRGKIVDHVFRSYALLRDMRVRVYLPPRYGEQDRSYPVAFLLHPWGADEQFYTAQLGLHETADRLINANALPPFVGVMPQGDKSFFLNAENPGGDFSLVLHLDPTYFAGALEGYGDYGDYLLDDVPGEIERRFRIRADRIGRVLAGVGMGAAGAAVLAFTHPGLFSAVGIHSPTLYTSSRFGPPWIFGLGDPAAFARRDPVQQACALEPDTGLRIYLDCGQDDEMAAPTHYLHKALLRRGVDHVYISRPGRQDVTYWQNHLAEYLGFYAAGW
jgi:enterochelin esterase-like enzyme